MGRYRKDPATRGSEKWLQVLVNERPDLFDALLRSAIKLPTTNKVEWLSPLKADEYAEYRDQSFLARLGVAPSQSSLQSFWPNLGPQWDGLGKTERGDLLLVEAKAHIPEAVTGKSKATNEASIQKIHEALEKTKQAFAPNADVEWATNFYQYANRLAHLYWLRAVNHLPAYMVFVYFCGDDDMDGPQTREEWEGAIKLLETFMGIRQSKLSQYVVNLFVDVRDLQ